MYRFILIATLFIGQFSFASDIDIRIYSDKDISSVSVGYLDGEFEVFSDSAYITTIKSEKDLLRFRVSDGLIKVSKGETLLGKYPSIKIRKRAFENSFRITALSPKLKVRKYKGNLTILPDGSNLKIINSVYLEHYIAGVIESESGARQDLEYYKIQAIISRTYALGHLNKYKSEGYHLCDNVTCQVYGNMSRYNENIEIAAELTKGMVLVDSGLNLITAAFHSNSGGYTTNSEEAWSSPLPYLRSVRDTFSLKKRNAYWSKTIPKSDWLNHLKKKYKYPIDDAAARKNALSFRQYKRKKYFVHPTYGVLLKKLRIDWRLKSTFFSVKEEGENVVISGRGFGHGVGLSQEGAMRMIELGYSFNSIIHYYYKDVHIVDLGIIDFYKAE